MLTFLQATNETLKRVGIIQGQQGELTSFSDSPRQTDIDVMIQSWNEVLADLYKFEPQPQQIAESTITLVSGQREYSLASDFEGFVTDPLDETNGDKLIPYPQGSHDSPYLAMIAEQLQPANYTGQPLYYCVNPTNGKLRLDTSPTSDDAGNVYTYRYRKRLGLSTTTDTFPCSDTVVEHLYPAVTEVWNYKRKETFSAGLYRRAMALAQLALNSYEIRSTY